MPRWNWPAARLHTLVAMVALFSCAPLTAWTAWQAVQAWQQQQQRQADDLQRRAQGLASAVQADIARSADALRLLVGSGWLDGQLQRQAQPPVQGIDRAQGTRALLAADPAVLLPGWLSLYLQQDADDSPLAVAPAGADGSLPASVALSVAAGPGRRLGALVSGQHWQQLLDRAAMLVPEGVASAGTGVALLLDDQHRVVMHSLGAAALNQPWAAAVANTAGSTASAVNRTAVTAGAAGTAGTAVTAVTTVQAGPPGLTAVQRLPGTGWSVAVSVPAGPPGRALLAAMAPAVTVALASLLLGLALAWRVARLLSVPLARLADQADAAKSHDGLRQDADLPRSSVQDIAALQTALAAAHGRQADAARTWQQRLADTHGALERAQQRIDAAQAATGIGFFHYTLDSDVVSGSAGHAQVLRGAGLQEPPASESLQAWSERLAPAQAEQLRAAVCELAAYSGAAGPPHAAAQTRAIELDSVGPAQRHLTLHLHARANAGQAAGAVTGVVVDTTEQQRAAASRERMVAAEHQARDAAEAARTAHAAKDSLLNMLGHELRNPLNGLTAAAEVLKLVGLRDPLARDAREVIERQGRQLTRLVDDFLDMARLTSGREQLTLAPLDLAALLREMVASPTLGRGLAANKATGTAAPAWIMGHRDRLLQMLGKLVEHAALKAGGGEDGDGDGDGDGGLWASVDHTSALPPTVALRIGWGRRSPDPDGASARSPTASAGRGATLGLEWVAALATLHGATLASDSGSDHGMVVIRFAALAAPEASGAVQGGMALAHAPRTVLIIEDNRDAALTLRLALEMMGHQIEACGDGREGLDALTTRPPEVAVIDIGLPGISGLVVARQARAAGYAGRLLAVSGSTTDDTSSRALKAGFDGYMTKPLSLPRLARWIAGPG